MKSHKLAAVAVALVTAITQAHADQTNFVQTLHVRLLAMKQGGATTNRNVVVTSVDTERLETRQIIGGIGAVIGNNFSRSSRLVLVTPVEGGLPGIEIREGDSKVDVTGFFAFEQIGGSVTRGVQFLRTGDSVQTTFSIQRLALQDFPGYPSLALHFDVRGLGIDTVNSRDGNGPRLDFRADVTGSGDSGGSPIVIQGSISTSGGTLEVVAVGGGGPS